MSGAITVGETRPEVSRLHLGAVTFLTPMGACGEEQVTALGDEIRDCAANGDRKVVVDLENAPLVDSAALEVLVEGQRTLTRAGGGLRLTNAHDTVREVLRLTRLDGYLALFDGDEEEPVDGAGGAQSGPSPGGARLGDALVARGLVSEEAVSAAVEEQKRSGERLGKILIARGELSEADLLSVLGERVGIPFVRLRHGLFDPVAVRLIDAATARRLQVVPLFRVHDRVFAATADPHAIPSLDELGERTGATVEPVLACANEITDVIGTAHSNSVSLGGLIGGLEVDERLEVIDETTPESEAEIDEMAAESPVVNLVNGLVQRAVQDGASDIHIEPSRGRSRVRFRIDGVLYTVMEPPPEVHPAVVSRLKVMANLDIAERRLPQDGRIQVVTQGRRIDLRFSSLPGIYGEKVVLRVLDKNQALMDIDKLGLSDENLARFRSLLGRSNGLLLVTGPTGSGKTTTLYAAINHLASVEKSIVTIEDPVEYQFDEINQNQVREAVGLGFARILKHVLRQDPDIVMVGEIREHETAQIAVQAALTGHLVLSTLHTNDSAGAITRLLDMGVESYLLSSALIGVMAQRLLRGVCPECRTTSVATPETLEPFGLHLEGNVRLARGRGCSSCHDSGYRGRFPVHELLVCDAETQQLMLSNPSREQLRSHLVTRGVKTLADDGYSRALAGATTLEEVARVLSAG